MRFRVTVFSEKPVDKLIQFILTHDELAEWSRLLILKENTWEADLIGHTSNIKIYRDGINDRDVTCKIHDSIRKIELMERWGR